jgi:RNA polymerase sigma-32 factor
MSSSSAGALSGATALPLLSLTGSAVRARRGLVAQETHGFGVPALGNLDAYIAAVQRIPLLTLEEETEFARRLRDEGDLDCARRLVMSHLRVVVAVARQFLGYGLPHADLIQEGNVGLMKAVRRFDPERGVRLVSFALHWIKAEIHEYVLRNWRLVRVATTKAQRKLFFNLRSMKGDTPVLDPAQIDTIARTLEVRAEDVIEMEERLAGREISIDAPVDDDGESQSPIAWLKASGAEPTQVLARREREQLHGEGLQRALEALDERSRRIVESRWLVDHSEGGGATLHDLAAQFGVSAERIRQIEAKALKTMRTALAAG